MPITIGYADLIDPTTGETKIGVAASDYDKERDGGQLLCPHPGCKAELMHRPAHTALGSKTIPAHFARMPNAAHDRSAGCPYPNKGDRPDAKSENRLFGFLNCDVQKYVYLNNNLKPDSSLRLPGNLRLRFRQVNGHPTVTRNEYEKTWGVSSAKDLATLYRHNDFGNDFYKNVKVVVSPPNRSGAFGIPFDKFFHSNISSLFRNAAKQRKSNVHHPVATIVRPSLVRSATNLQKDSDGWYYMDCLPEATDGVNIPGKEFNLTPVLRTRDPAVFEKLKDTQRTMVVGTIDDFDKASSAKTAKDIAAGRIANRLPITITVNSVDQIEPMNF